MSILSTNPGYVSAALYAADPTNVAVDSPFYNESDLGFRSYVLSSLVAGTPLFSQDVQGSVPGPTAADITANRLIDANGVWVDPGGGGLNSTGNGLITQAAGGNSGGNVNQAGIGTAEIKSGIGDFANGFVDANGFAGDITADSGLGGGSVAFAYVKADTQAAYFRVNSFWGGSGHGYALNGTVNIAGQGSHGEVNAASGGDAQTQGDNARIYGKANGAGAVILAANDNTVVDAWPEAGETASATGNRSHQIGVGTNTVSKSWQIGAGVLHVEYTPAAEKIALFKVAPVLQPAGADQVALGAVTLIGANTGTPGVGLSLIGDTSTIDQSAALMNDFAALREDVASLFTLVGAMRTAGVDLGTLKGAA